ncbi:hypothetical protein ACOME3_008247 [Neoechinorhynchus agilis]
MMRGLQRLQRQYQIWNSMRNKGYSRMSKNIIDEIYHEAIQKAIANFMFVEGANYDDSPASISSLSNKHIPMILVASKDGIMNWSSDADRLKDLWVAMEHIHSKSGISNM